MQYFYYYYEFYLVIAQRYWRQGGPRDFALTAVFSRRGRSLFNLMISLLLIGRAI